MSLLDPTGLESIPAVRSTKPVKSVMVTAARTRIALSAAVQGSVRGEMAGTGNVTGPRVKGILFFDELTSAPPLQQATGLSGNS